MASDEVSAAASAARGGVDGVAVSEAREITFDDVLSAGRLLFGPAFVAEEAGWRERLKAIYRLRALETHPDRARALGRAEPDLVREFRAVTEAYRILSSLRGGADPRAAASPEGGRDRAPSVVAAAVRGRPRRTPPTPEARPSTPRPSPASRSPAGDPGAPTAAPRVRGSVPPADLPRRRLRFAEFLYYSGRVRWSELVDAICWQRRQRPPLGRIAVDLGFLEPDDVGVILERRREAGANAVPFGEWAVRLRYLSSFQLLAALGHQLRAQQPIGRFFVERGILAEHELGDVQSRILRHNAGLWR